MHAERDHIVRIVFPRLREWCADRRLHIIDIDLRWGITREEAENGKATEICLKEIDGCRPFFVCILGEQYGWIPADTKNHTSITHAEIAHALLQADKPRAAQAFFYFRDPSVLPRPEDLEGYSFAERNAYQAAYFTPPPKLGEVDGRAALQNLKTEIFNQFADDGRVYVYPCLWAQDFHDPSAPNARGRIVGLDAFGKRLEDDIKRGIQEEFREHLAAIANEPSSLEREESAQQAFIASRTQLDIADMSVQRAITQYVAGDLRSPIVLTGPPGAGKSAALAYWVEQIVHHESYVVGMSSSPTVLFRSVGASPQSAQLSGMLESIALSLQLLSQHAVKTAREPLQGEEPPAQPRSTKRLSLRERAVATLKRLLRRPPSPAKPTAPIAAVTTPTRRGVASAGDLQKQIEIPRDPEEMVRLWPRILEAFSSRIAGQVVIIIDGLNQLGQHTQPGLASWIPTELPEGVKLVLSVADDSQTRFGEAASWLGVLRSRGFPEVLVPPLDEAQRRTIVRELPSIYSKSLDQAQTEKLLGNHATSNPLFLCVALQALRTFGSFSRLDEAIDRLPRADSERETDKALASLFDQILDSLQHEIDAEVPGLVSRVFGFLACARNGLSERELDALLAISLPETSAENRKGALQVTLRQVRPYLSRKESHGVVLIDFFHQSFLGAVTNRYLADLPTKISHHRDLAAFFDVEPLHLENSNVGSQPNGRKLTELVWQRLRVVDLALPSRLANDLQNLANPLLDWRYMEAKHEAGLIFELSQELDAAKVLLRSHAKGRLLTILSQALRADIHFISRHRGDYPQALFQCIWNACWWYDHPSAAEHYPNPEEAGTVFDGTLSDWVENYRAQKSEHEGGSTVWLRQLRPGPSRLGAKLQTEFREASGSLIAFSPNGRYLLTGGMPSPALILWDLANSQEVYRIERVKGTIHSLDISADGQFFAIGLGAKVTGETIHLYSLSSGQRLKTLTGHRISVTTVQFSADGQYLLSASNDSTCRIWHSQSGREIWCLGDAKPYTQAVPSAPSRMIPGGHTLVRALADQTCLEIWDWSEHRRVARIETGVGAWGTLVVSPCGSWLAATNGFSKDIFLWDLRSIAQSPRRLGPLPEWQREFAFSPDAKCLVVASGNVIVAWDAETGAEITVIRGAFNARDMAFSPDGLCAVSTNAGIHFLTLGHSSPDKSNIFVGASELTLEDHDNIVSNLKFSPDGLHLVTGAREDSETTLRVWSTRTMRLSAGSPRIKEKVDQVLFSADSSHFVASGQLCSTSVWSLSDIGERRVLGDAASRIKHVVRCPADESLWIGTSTSAQTPPTKIFDPYTGTARSVPEGIPEPRAFSESGDMLGASNRNDGYSSYLAVVEVATLTCRAFVSRTEGVAEVMAFSPDGETLAYAHGPGAISIFRWRENLQLLRLTGHSYAVKKLVFSRDGIYLTSSCKSAIVVWNLDTGERVRVFEGTGDIEYMGAAPFAAGTWPLAARNEQQIIDRRTGECIARAPGSWYLPTRHPSESMWSAICNSHLNAWRLERLAPKSNGERSR
jgi:WD40 repeat protein